MWRVLWMNASGTPPRRADQRSATLIRPASGRDHGERLVAVLLLDVVGQDRQRHQVVDRAVEESLDLIGVEVHGDQPVGAGGLEEVGHQSRRDRLATAVLLVLTGVAVERQHHGDPLGRRPLERVDHDQVLHDPLVDRRRVALDHEGVTAPDRLLVADVDLGVRELVGRCRHQAAAEERRHLLGQLGVGPAAEDHQVLLGGPLHSGHVGCAPRSTKGEWLVGALRIVDHRTAVAQLRGPSGVHPAFPEPLGAGRHGRRGCAAGRR